VDVDLSSKLYNSILVDKENHALKIDVEYEKQLLFCSYCKSIGHSIQNFKRIVKGQAMDPNGKTKKQVIQKERIIPDIAPIVWMPRHQLLAILTLTKKICLSICGPCPFEGDPFGIWDMTEEIQVMAQTLSKKKADGKGTQDDLGTKKHRRQEIQLIQSEASSKAIVR
jgi:hypothetical protein